MSQTVLVHPVEFGSQQHLLLLQTEHRRSDEFLFLRSLPNLLTAVTQIVYFETNVTPLITQRLNA